MNRRKFLGTALGGAIGSIAANNAWAAGRLAWPGPIGLELYTVRKLFAKDPARTLKQVASVGYKEVEISQSLKPSVLAQDLRAAGLAAPSGYFAYPKTLDDWKREVDAAHNYGVKYLVVGHNQLLSADTWKRIADFFNQCGSVSQKAGIQFCYHAHFHEFARIDGTDGYDILLARCDPKLLKMEMDIFWVTYAGKDPLTYWRRYPGRFPLLHIKDMKRDVKIDPDRAPGAAVNPFAPVGQGRIDWQRIFAHVHEAGAKHIFVEQDRCDGSPLDAIKTSYHYLRHLRLS
ncbi:MAG TPA: sugar phosphate isomerase/epimerase [Bryobacteraceae bacterium]